MSNRCRSRRMSLASLKGVSSRSANSSPSIRDNANRGIFGHTAPEDRHQRPPSVSGERRRRAGTDSEIECRRDVRHAGEVDGLVAFSTSDVDEKLFGNGVRDGLIVGHRRLG